MNSWELLLQGGKTIVWLIFGSFLVLKRNEDSPLPQELWFVWLLLVCIDPIQFHVNKVKTENFFFDDVEKFLSQLLSCGHGIVVMFFIFYREIQFSPREGPQFFCCFIFEM